MDLVPRPRWPHLLREVSRHGTVRWVVRVGHGPRTPIRAPYGSPEFEAEYHEAIAGKPPERPAAPSAGTLRWLWDRYQQSQEWRALSLNTQRQRVQIMRGVLEGAGDAPAASITREEIVNGRDRRADKAAAPRHFVATLRALFKWAVQIGLVPSDPTSGVKTVKRPTDGYAVWPDEWVEKFCQRWPLGTRQRLAFEVLYCTGLRRSDACQIGRQHVRNGVLYWRAQKNRVEVFIPILPRLDEAIKAGPTGDLHFIATEAGHPRSVKAFSMWFREACDAAGVPGSAHGLRKAVATMLADRGASEWELDATLGWTGGKTSAIYTRRANRERLAAMAMKRLDEPYSQPSGTVGKDKK